MHTSAGAKPSPLGCAVNRGPTLMQEGENFGHGKVSGGRGRAAADGPNSWHEPLPRVPSLGHLRQRGIPPRTPGRSTPLRPDGRNDHAPEDPLGAAAYDRATPGI